MGTITINMSIINIANKKNFVRPHTGACTCVMWPVQCTNTDSKLNFARYRVGTACGCVGCWGGSGGTTFYKFIFGAFEITGNFEGDKKLKYRDASS